MGAAHGTVWFDGGDPPDGDLPATLRQGLPRLHEAAAAAGIARGTVDAVIAAAWSPYGGFVAHGTDGFHDVVDASLAVNGWAWTEAVLVEPARRRECFASVTTAARRSTRRTWSRLPEPVREAAADDAMLGLSTRLLEDPPSGYLMPGWASWTVVKQNVRWRLTTAASRYDAEHARGQVQVISLEAHWEAVGEHEVRDNRVGAGSVDGRAVEAVVWASAAAHLARHADAMVAGTRSGAARDKVALTVAAAGWVLSEGATDQRDVHGDPVAGSAEERRHQFAQDPLIVSFQALRQVAPRTWGRYPADRVPTREVIEHTAREAAARGDENAAWFATLEARRVEVAKSDRLLHGIRQLVERLLREAAHDEGD